MTCEYFDICSVLEITTFFRRMKTASVQIQVWATKPTCHVPSNPVAYHGVGLVNAFRTRNGCLFNPSAAGIVEEVVAWVHAEIDLVHVVSGW